MDLFIGLIFSSIGVGYLIYGKKSEEYVFLFFGAALMIYPYFIHNTLVNLILGVLLAVAPIAARRFL